MRITPCIVASRQNRILTDSDKSLPNHSVFCQKSVTKTVKSESLPLGEVAKAAVTSGFLIHHRNAVAAKTDDETVR